MEENGTKFINLESTVTNCDHFRSIILLKLHPYWDGVFLIYCISTEA